MKDERGEPVFSGPTVNKILAETIIEHAADHAKNQTSASDGAAQEATKKNNDKRGCCGKDKMDKKAIVKIALLALTGIITVACFLLVGNFYFIKKGGKKK
ncbi:MAG: hypothetical protein PHC61_19090 [Chitinivibrionales bacterium]|nr:hypothetical protein [Chitinivibrionales bacterium]